MKTPNIKTPGVPYAQKYTPWRTYAQFKQLNGSPGHSPPRGRHSQRRGPVPKLLWAYLLLISVRIVARSLSNYSSCECDVSCYNHCMSLWSAGNVHPDQLRASSAGAWCCDWSWDWDDWKAHKWRRARWLVRWLGSAWTDPVDSWYHTVTAPGISQLLPLTIVTSAHCDHLVVLWSKMFMFHQVKTLENIACFIASE